MITMHVSDKYFFYLRQLKIASYELMLSAFATIEQPQI